MPTLSETKIEEIRTHMLHEEEALKIKFKAKNNEYESISVPHNEVDAYEKTGYSVIKRSSRKSTLVRKKSHDILFEDNIWCMFYNLGFRILNRDEKLVVQWGDNDTDTQQLDVVAINDEAIFVVECKAAVKSSTRPFKTELNKMDQYINGVSEVLRNIYGASKRVKFIFATRNYRFADDSEDIQRMNNSKIFHLNDNSYNYICNLIKSYKSTAKYQFMGLMFKDELINYQGITIPALRGTMGEKEYFLFSIEPSTLLKIGFILHRTKVNDSLAPTYQRLLVPSRLKGITKFIDEDGGYFPNSIIINFANPNSDVKVTFDMIHKENSSDSEFGLLNIPNAYGIAYIIDGQHRVYGYANSKFKNSHTIPVVAFNDMKPEEQLKIFMEINENQKAVSPSLRLDLEEDLYWNAERLDSRMKALRSSIIKLLNANSNHILYNMISVGEDNAKLAFKPFDTALSQSGLIPKAKTTSWIGDADICIYNINETDFDKAMKESRKNITSFINAAYNLAYKKIDEDKQDDFLFSNRATYAFIVLLGSIHKHLIKTGVLYSNSTIQERIAAITPYVDCLSKGLNNLSEEDTRTIKGCLGQGADSFWLHSYQNIINKTYSDYCPDELTTWKETQNQTIQSEGAQRKEDIRRQVRCIVFDRLSQVFGSKWISKVAILQHEVEGRILKDFGDNDGFELSDYDWKEYVYMSEFKELIDKNFSYPEFENPFAINLGFAFKTKKDKLAWFNRIIETKKKSDLLTQSDLNFLEQINTHLQQYMPIDQ